MLTRDQIRDRVHAEGLSRADRLFLCFGMAPTKSTKVWELVEVAKTVGVREAANWNISQILKNQKGLVALALDGWELTANGRKHFKKLAGLDTSAQTATVATALWALAGGLPNPDTAAFVLESVACLQAGLLRAAVVLSWAGAVGVLHDHVVAKCLPQFNAEGARRDPKWRPVTNTHGLARVQERNFLDLLEGAPIIGKSVRDELQACLRLRNGCAHPNKLKVGEARAQAQVESLINNVFAAF